MVLKTDGFLPGWDADQKADSLLFAVNELHHDFERLQEGIADAVRVPRFTQQDADTAVTDALADLKSDLDVQAVKDLSVAILGVAITAAGVIFGLV
ncbi:MAG: hypothetical protein JWN03_5682 [Nocardia sp.]|nr:hypothetical protein [Nocardia sp.]